MKVNARTIISSIPIFLIILAGCASTAKTENNQSWFAKLPFVYKMTVQQGNLLTAETIGQLQIGMSKHQVAALLGTPLLNDFFHTNRWDYIYTMQRKDQPFEQHSLTLYFQADNLIKIADNSYQKNQQTTTATPTDILIKVPDYQAPKGFWARRLQTTENPSERRPSK